MSILRCLKRRNSRDEGVQCKENEHMEENMTIGREHDYPFRTPLISRFLRRMKLKRNLEQKVRPVDARLLSDRPSCGLLITLGSSERKHHICTTEFNNLYCNVAKYVLLCIILYLLCLRIVACYPSYHKSGVLIRLWFRVKYSSKFTIA